MQISIVREHDSSSHCPSAVFGPESIVVIGRDSNCDFVINGHGVSRKHCQLEFKHGSWMLFDLGSINGTIVDGVRVGKTSKSISTASVFLQSKCALQLGDTFLTLIVEPVAETASPPNEDESVRTALIDEVASTIPVAPIQQEEVFRTIFAEPRQTDSNSQSSDQLQGTLCAAVRPVAVAECSETVRPGNLVRGYRIDKKIGSGGMGDVYLACHESSPSKKYAIKFFRSEIMESDLNRLRFLREMDLMKELEHPVLIRAIESGEEGGRLFFVMDYCMGGDLHSLLQKSGSLPVRRVVKLMHRLLAGIGYAHNLGIVHRDLKPSNILLNRLPSGRYSPKIGDLGLAKCYFQAGASGITINGSVGGTWGYMPVEQLKNFRLVSPSSDVWSLGAIMYECLTLQLPRPLISGDPVRTVLESQVVPIEKIRSDIPPALARFIARSLARAPEHRFQDGKSMQESLAEVAKNIGVDL
jgi:serine/threonine protein kinase